jgi:hypothetical protein
MQLLDILKCVVPQNGFLTQALLRNSKNQN